MKPMKESQNMLLRGTVKPNRSISMLGGKQVSTHERKEPTDQDSCRPLRDDEIVTERRFSRRSFVAATGVFLTGGAMALLMDRTALAVQNGPDQPKPADPDSPKPADPDSKKSTDPDSKKHKHHHHRRHHKEPPPTDPTAPPPTDPNAPPPTNP